MTSWPKVLLVGLVACGSSSVDDASGSGAAGPVGSGGAVGSGGGGASGDSGGSGDSSGSGGGGGSDRTVGPQCEPEAPVAGAYYVATTGSNDHSCSDAQDPATPKATINGALPCLGPGSTLYVRGGTYDENIVDVPVSGSSWSNAVRIAAYDCQSEPVWMKPSSGTYVIYMAANEQYIEFDGINIDASGTISAVTVQGHASGNPHHIRFKNLEVKNAPAHGFLIAAMVNGIVGGNEFIHLQVRDVGTTDFDHGFYISSADNLVDSCDVFGVTGAAVHLYNGYGVEFGGNIVRDNVIHDARLDPSATSTRKWGIVMANGSVNANVHDNEVYAIVAEPGYAFRSFGIHSFFDTASEIHGNYVHDNEGTGIALDSSTNANVHDNVSANNAVGNYADNGTGTVWSNNN